MYMLIKKYATPYRQPNNNRFLLTVFADNLLELGQQNMTHQMQEVEARTELEHFRQQLNARILQTTELSGSSFYFFLIFFSI